MSNQRTSLFIQLHMLTPYPPANLNRDDLGRPKTALMGGAQRIRVSSQSLKRAWRTSDLFATRFESSSGVRTKEVGSRVVDGLSGIEGDAAEAIAKKIADVFGKLTKTGHQTEQLVHLSRQELRNIDSLIEKANAGQEPTDDDYTSLLTDGRGSPDIALFGRMLADDPQANVEAAAQVAHAVTVHKVSVEDDFFTAVDDLRSRAEDLGAGHMGVREFGSGLFYQYLCINRTLLKENLGSDEALTTETLRTLVEVCTTVSPTGYQASFASRARASYLLAERGTAQPRSLAAAFYKPIRGTNLLEDSVRQLVETREAIDAVYGACSDESASFDVGQKRGSLAEVLDFVGASL